MHTQIIQACDLHRSEIGTFHTAPAETKWDTDDVRVYIDTRVIMGLLKMMHRRSIFRFCDTSIFLPLPSRGNSETC